jgi:hypothetical protein
MKFVPDHLYMCADTRALVNLKDENDVINLIGLDAPYIVFWGPTIKDATIEYFETGPMVNNPEGLLITMKEDKPFAILYKDAYLQVDFLPAYHPPEYITGGPAVGVYNIFSSD